MRYIVNDPDHSPALYEEEWEASRQFEDLVERLREQATNGCHPNAEKAFWGEVIPRARLSLHGMAQPDADSGADYAAGYEQGLKSAVSFLRIVAAAGPSKEGMAPAVQVALQRAADAIEVVTYLTSKNISQE